MLTHRSLLVTALAVLLTAAANAADLPRVTNVELQPLGQQAKRVADTLELLGVPLAKAERDRLEAATTDKDNGIRTIQDVLDRHCLTGVRITTDKMEVIPGPARPELAEQGWRVFLVKVVNPSGIDKVELRPDSPNALPLTQRSTSASAPTVTSLGEVGKRFLDLQSHNSQPLLAQLSGLELEYRVLQVYCRDSGRKEGSLGFSLWRQVNMRPQLVLKSDLTTFLFEAQPAVVVKLQVRDIDSKPVMGAFTFRDAQGRVYPAMSRRLAPDFNFHPQIYRRDGETVTLQPGKYIVTWTRGPEYLVSRREIVVPAKATHSESFELKRWVHPAKKFWYSGDHHIHAAGCSHYESPTEGVTPADMMRHILGEDLNVGLCLSWGPCWYHQKRYFEKKTEKHDRYPVHPLSTPTHLLRYDIEVSGFPSSHCGHICLLRLKEQDYPGTRLIEEWPSWDLPVFRWAKSQDAVVGFAHSGWGLDPETGDPNIRELPNYIVPKMGGIGANEYLVDVAHDMCDFISTVDTPAVWELNIWYHTLNCGYRCRISGETDFPCIYGERVGLGRSYVQIHGDVNFDDWVEGIKRGRCYVSDGKSHLLDFEVNGTGVGLKDSEVKLDKPGKVTAKAKVAALLEPEPTPETQRIRNAPMAGRPYWELERSRIDNTRKVPVELIVNGFPVARKEITADGKEQEVTFEADIKHSSWVAMRIFPSSHTNPVFVVVDGKPIRASKKSAEWCLKGIDNCWKMKRPNIRERERTDAAAAYEQARESYRKILAESVAD